MSLGNEHDSQGNVRVSDKFNLTTPAGWAMVYFFGAVVILSLLFFSV